VRIGHGFDVHRFSDDPKRALWLGLVHIEDAVGLDGHSDADVATHALCNAVLAASGLGDLGRHFPSVDVQWRDAASSLLLGRVMELLSGVDATVVSADVTICAERPRLATYLELMSSALSTAVGTRVTVKVTSTDGLGSVGRGEGIAATAVALVEVMR
jgi:2-C-methyl-D-erythritol 2,4-cyclodiphosphate synthase